LLDCADSFFTPAQLSDSLQSGKSECELAGVESQLLPQLFAAIITATITIYMIVSYYEPAKKLKNISKFSVKVNVCL